MYYNMIKKSFFQHFNLEIQRTFQCDPIGICSDEMHEIQYDEIFLLLKVSIILQNSATYFVLDTNIDI